MSRQQALQSAPAPAEQANAHRHVVDADCYTAAQIIAKLQISKATFYRLIKRGRFPFVQELERFGHSVRYRRAPVDRYLAGERNQPRAFRAHGRQCAASSASAISPIFGR